MPIIVLALLLFVLLAFAGVVLLSLALRYRAGTARRQARRWVASLNIWMTSFSAVFFLSFTLLLSFCRLSVSIRPDWYGLWRHSRLGRLAMTRWESQPRTFYPKPLARASHHVGDRCTFHLRLVARHALRQQCSGDQHWLITASGTQLSLAVAAGLIGYYLVYSVGVRLRLARHEQRQFN